MRGIVKAFRRPRRFARATGGGFSHAFGPGLSDGVPRGSRCPASPRHAHLAESPSLRALGKPPPVARAIRRAGGEPRAMRGLVKAVRRPRRFARAISMGHY